MKTTRLLAVLTALNLAILMYQIGHLRIADAEEPLGILRGSGIEIVDSEGRLRSQIKVEPAGTSANGDPYPDTVIFRLITPDGKPRVKLATTPDSAGLSFVGATDATHVLLKAEGSQSLLTLNNESGALKTMQP